ncbi:MAG: hypothetical protein M0T83_05020, partial [Nitrospiraceae bacterium]|nr:hypothetical protein [Nitrospiraceae bacterium]
DAAPPHLPPRALPRQTPRFFPWPQLFSFGKFVDDEGDGAIREEAIALRGRQPPMTWPNVLTLGRH